MTFKFCSFHSAFAAITNLMSNEARSRMKLNLSCRAELQTGLGNRRAKNLTCGCRKAISSDMDMEDNRLEMLTAGTTQVVGCLST